MLRCLILMFSQAGATAKVAGAIANGLCAEGYEIDVQNLRDRQPVNTDGYDLIGVGAPTYYYRPPFNMIDAVKKLPDLEGRPAFVFVIHGSYRGDAGTWLRRALAQKHAKEVGYFPCRGADYFLGYLRQGYLFSPESPTPDDLARAAAFGRAVVARVRGESVTVAGLSESPDPPATFLNRLERSLVNRWVVRQIATRLFHVNENLCSCCDRCVRQCPTGTITRDERGRLVWGRDCLLCLFCEMNCPREAITSPLSWRIFRPFLWGNVRHAARDAALDHVRITHEKGETRRID